MSEIVTAYIAIGSNLGDREASIRNALMLLDQTEGVSVKRVSTLFENPAMGGPPGAPDFLNAAAEIHTSLQPQALLDRLMEIERTLGRMQREKWAPREIDLDLLLYGDSILSGRRGSHELTIPHPLMHERMFVLKPLAEIAPTVMHPVLRQTIGDLLEALRAKPQ